MISPSLRVDLMAALSRESAGPGAGVFMNGDEIIGLELCLALLTACTATAYKIAGRPYMNMFFWVLFLLQLGLLLLVPAHADTWNRCKEGTLIRIEPGPGFVCECPGAISECHCPPLLSCIEPEKEAAECKRINAGLLSERDGFAALHQREAADNRRCKRNLKKCRRRK